MEPKVKEKFVTSSKVKKIKILSLKKIRVVVLKVHTFLNYYFSCHGSEFRLYFRTYFWNCK